jgi:hypothetical protein
MALLLLAGGESKSGLTEDEDIDGDPVENGRSAMTTRSSAVEEGCASGKPVHTCRWRDLSAEIVRVTNALLMSVYHHSSLVYNSGVSLPRSPLIDYTPSEQFDSLRLSLQLRYFSRMTPHCFFCYWISIVTA